MKDIRVIVGGRELPQEDIGDRAKAGLIVGAILVAGALVAMAKMGGW